MSDKNAQPVPVATAPTPAAPTPAAPTLTVPAQFNDEINKTSTFHTNLGQDVITTDANKIRLILHKKYEGMKAEREWTTPLAICLSLVVTLVSASFKETWGLSSPTWHAMFVIGALLSAAWSIICLIKAFRQRGENTIEAIVTEILNSRSR